MLRSNLVLKRIKKKNVISNINKVLYTQLRVKNKPINRKESSLVLYKPGKSIFKLFTKKHSKYFKYYKKNNKKIKK